MRGALVLVAFLMSSIVYSQERSVGLELNGGISYRYFKDKNPQPSTININPNDFEIPIYSWGMSVVYFHPSKSRFQLFSRLGYTCVGWGSEWVPVMYANPSSPPDPYAVQAKFKHVHDFLYLDMGGRYRITNGSLKLYLSGAYSHQFLLSARSVSIAELSDGEIQRKSSNATKNGLGVYRRYVPAIRLAMSGEKYLSAKLRLSVGLSYRQYLSLTKDTRYHRYPFLTSLDIGLYREF